MTSAKADLISQCRYFSGEDECPFVTDNLKLYWNLERSFVCNAQGNIIPEQDELYKAIGGRDYEGIPRALLIWMFGAYMKQAYDVKESLPNFYQFIDGYLFAA